MQEQYDEEGRLHSGYECLSCGRPASVGFIEGIFQCSICLGYVAGSTGMGKHLISHMSESWRWDQDEIEPFFQSVELVRVE